jgi:hypothetical protein
MVEIGGDNLCSACRQRRQKKEGLGRGEEQVILLAIAAAHAH